MMSILAQVATDQQQTGQLSEVLVPIVLVAWTLGASAAVWRFRRSFAQPLRGGEPRLAPDESLANYAMILLAGLFAWILVPALYGAATRQASATRPATTPLATEASEVVLLVAVVGFTSLVILLAGNVLFRRDGLSRLGLRLGQLLPAIRIGIIGIVLIMPFILWATVVTAKLWEMLGLEHETKHEMLRILTDTKDRGLARLLVFTAGALVPVYEEVLFRGHLQTLLVLVFARLRPERDAVMEPYATPNAALMRPQGPSPAAKWMAIIVTSLAFAVVHAWWTIPPIFLLSVCLGYAYERWNNLWVPIVLHALFNSIMMAISQVVPQ